MRSVGVISCNTHPHWKTALLCTICILNTILKDRNFVNCYLQGVHAGKINPTFLLLSGKAWFHLMSVDMRITAVSVTSTRATCLEHSDHDLVC